MLGQILYLLSWVFLSVYVFIMMRFDVRKRSLLPPGPKLFVANHPSAIDPFLIHLVTKEKIHVMITDKAFQVPVFGSFLRRVGEIPVPLEKGSAALEHASKALQAGHSVAIFIEGSFSPEEGGFLPPRTGAARLALGNRVPVVPVGISLQRHRIMKIRARISGAQAEGRWYLRGPYAITVGDPIHFRGDAEDREHVRKISGIIMDNIRELARESEVRMDGLELASA